VEGVGNHFESHCASRHCRGFIHQLFAGRVLDPELAQIGADAVDRAFKELGAFAVTGFVDGKFDGRRTEFLVVRLNDSASKLGESQVSKARPGAPS
jgi:hypothetical protein